MLPVHPAMQQTQRLFDSARNVTADIFAIAFYMAQIAIRHANTLCKHLQHAAFRQIRIRISEPLVQRHEILVKSASTTVAGLAAVGYKYNLSKRTNGLRSRRQRQQGSGQQDGLLSGHVPQLLIS